MDALMCSTHLLWWVKILIVMGISVAVLIPFYLLKKKWVIWIGQKPLLSPNWITTHRVWIAYLGYWFYFNGSFTVALCLIALGYALDAFDGITARALGPLNPDKKGWGKVYDPLADKLAVLPFMTAMWYRGHLDGYLLCGLLVTEVIGTVLRKPLIENRWFQRATSAQNVGKVKFFAQVLCLMACLPVDQKWVAGESAVPNWLLGLSCVAGVLSVLSRLRITPAVDWSMDKLNASLDSVIAFFQRGGIRRFFIRG